MPYLTNLAVIARRTGFPVVEQPGWRTRGHGPMGDIRSVVCHHDAARQSPTTFNTVVQNGRAGLRGPLAQFTIRRDGTIHVVAAGLSWHAGATVNDGVYGNSHAIGIEAGNDGVGEPWPRRQLDAYEALCAELCKAFGLPASRVQGHREICSPSGRKIDPAGIDMTGFRAAVARRMKGEDDMTPSEFARMDYGVRVSIENQRRIDRATAIATETQRRVTGLVAAVDALSQAVANNSGCTPEELKKAVTDAIEAGVVKVDVEVKGA